MRYLPIGLDTRGKTILVVGGGKVALQKIRVLLRTEVRVKVVTLEALPEVRQLAVEGQIDLAVRAYRPEDVQDMTMVISATNDRVVNEAVRADAHHAGILVNVVDVANLCDLIFMSIFEREDYVVAMSTDARRPGHSKYLRVFIEEKIDEFLRGGNRF